MASVFLSYDHDDVARAAPIASALEKAGHSVWWDRQIHGGAEYQSEIESAVQHADAVVVLWSGKSIKSAWVRDEAAEGRDQGKLVPVLLESVKPPMGFRQYQTIDLSDQKRASGAKDLAELLRAITKVSAAAPSTQLSPLPAASEHGIDRRALLAGGAVAAVAVAGVGGWVLLRPDSADASDSIAVLPFENLSGDPAQAYFAAGIAGEIRNILTRIAGLKVAGSTSSEAVREDDARTAAKKLRVTNILTGNVRQTPSAIRITAELIDGRTGLAKWSQNYDRAPGDVIKIQTDIAEKVTRALAVALGASARKALAAETSNIAAQTLAFQARDLSWQYTVPAFQRSLQLIDQAIALDPNYGRAYALKAFFTNNLATLTSTTPAELARGRTEALQYAKIAVSKAPDQPIARSGLGFAYAVTLQVRNSLREHKIAISLPGGEPDVMRNYGYAMSSSGKPDEALRYVDEALALDPLNAGSHTARATVLFSARRYEEVVRYSLKLKQESPELFNFSVVLGLALLLLGRTKEAAAAIGDSIIGQALLATRTGNRDLALAKLAEMRRREGDMKNFYYAAIYAQVGDKERAFAALNRAWDLRDSDLLSVKVNPFLDPLRSDPRYAALVKKVGFPD
ncbi:MAG TPA: TIR domain-containing protein [Sphingomicrobium sp.]|nr:TIR domain-containing protein [Sphingomicrobium sp.]